MIVAGGIGGEDDDTLDSVEVFDGKPWSEDVYPPMPAPNVDFCIIKVDSNTILVTGGESNNLSELYCCSNKRAPIAVRLRPN